MGDATSGNYRIHWDEIGPADGPAVLLIMGLGAQMIAWRDGFRQQLVDHGFRVIRFDNRDVGLSTKTDAAVPQRRDLVRRVLRLSPPPPPYTLSDMAGDAMAVLDAAGVGAAHIVGASMGGMIAQVVAIEHPDRVLSLTSIMSKTGSPLSGRPTAKAVRMMLTPRNDDPAGRLAAEVDRYRFIAGPLFDRKEVAAFTRQAIERCYNPDGAAHQLAAVLAAPDRTAALASITVPTLVIHGRQDPLIVLSGGEATARAVPNARLLVFNDMGHDLPRVLWPAMTDAIATTAAAATPAPARPTEPSPAADGPTAPTQPDTFVPVPT